MSKNTVVPMFEDVNEMSEQCAMDVNAKFGPVAG